MAKKDAPAPQTFGEWIDERRPAPVDTPTSKDQADGMGSGDIGGMGSGGMAVDDMLPPPQRRRSRNLLSGMFASRFRLTSD